MTIWKKRKANQSTASTHGTSKPSTTYQSTHSNAKKYVPYDKDKGKLEYSSKQSNYKYTRLECHEGNQAVYTVPNGGTLYGGGWTRGAKIQRNMAVVDLTATLGMGTLDIEPINSLAQQTFSNLLRSLGMNTPLLNLYIADYEIPKKMGLPQWTAFAKDIENYLMSGRDVLVCCTGGHGRTGLVLAIVCSLLDPKLVGSNPVPWIRDTLCHDCVETQEQIDYVYHTLGLPEPKTVRANYYGANINVKDAPLGYNNEPTWEKWMKEFDDIRYKEVQHVSTPEG